MNDTTVIIILGKWQEGKMGREKGTGKGGIATPTQMYHGKNFKK